VAARRCERLALAPDGPSVPPIISTLALAMGASRETLLLRSIRRWIRMIKNDIAADVAREAEITMTRASQCVEIILEGLKAGLRDRGRIELRGFGVFIVRPRKGGIGRNPRTGEVFPLRPGRVVRFRPGKVLGG
jgi:nucleoid DNA-binding protein